MSPDITHILNAIDAGDPSGAAELLPLVYHELCKLAAARLAGEKPGQTLQATALVHEAYLRLVGDHRGLKWDGRGHFYAAAAEAMRRILIDRARRKLAAKHGAGAEHIRDGVAEIAGPDGPANDLLAVHEALDGLAAHDSRKAELVKLRYFAGLTIEEAADVLGISPATAKRDWTYARAWLFRAISES